MRGDLPRKEADGFSTDAKAAGIGISALFGMLGTLGLFRFDSAALSRGTDSFN
jgi:hypothetical protein